MNYIDFPMKPYLLSFVFGLLFFLSSLYFLFIENTIGDSDHLSLFLTVVYCLLMSILMGLIWFVSVPFLVLCAVIYKSIIILKK